MFSFLSLIIIIIYKFKNKMKEENNMKCFILNNKNLNKKSNQKMKMI